MAAFYAATTLQTTPTNTLHLNPLVSYASLQRSSRQLHKINLSSSLCFSRKLNLSSSSRVVGLFFCSSSSQDETLVTDDVEPQVEDAEGTTTDDDSIEADGTAVEDSPASILASLQSYKEALADNDEPKIAEIETQIKSVEDEKLVLERQLAALSEELSSAKDRVLRISADFDNFRKRTERERVTLVANAQGEVVENLLPVLDNFERAKAAIKVENEKEEKINNSYQSIYKQFVEILNSLGVVPVETTGQPFDPLLHEAIMREESTEFDEGVVIQEFRKGFRIGERLLRPSMVKVSAGPGPEITDSVSPSPDTQVPESSEEPEDVVEDQSEASSDE
ncbi:GrpE nucleotide exchange factor [Tanacetum coccineum]